VILNKILRDTFQARMKAVQCVADPISPNGYLNSGCIADCVNNHQYSNATCQAVVPSSPATTDITTSDGKTLRCDCRYEGNSLLPATTTTTEAASTTAATQ
jgi:hypothetical protein